MYQRMMVQCYERHLAKVVQGCGGDRDEVYWDDEIGGTEFESTGTAVAWIAVVTTGWATPDLASKLLEPLCIMATLCGMNWG